MKWPPPAWMFLKRLKEGCHFLPESPSGALAIPNLYLAAFFFHKIKPIRPLRLQPVYSKKMVLPLLV